MARVYVNYHEVMTDSEYGDEEEYASWHTSYYFTVTHVTSRSVSPYHESFEVGDLPEKNPQIFVTYVIYGDGDTFGRNDGKGKITGAFLTRAEAEAQRVKDNLPSSKVDTFRPWDDYFGGLERTEIECFVLDKFP